MGGRIRSITLVVVATAAVMGTASIRPLDAQQTVPDGGDEGERSVVETDGGGWLHAILGESPDRNRVIPGLWAMHPFEAHFPELDATRGFGGLYGHWFGATFVNSYDQRTFILGIERNWLAFRRGHFGFGAGYRVGFITGYDERLIEFARHTPVLPFGGLLIWTQLGPVGLDSYYVYRAITLETSLVF